MPGEPDREKDEGDDLDEEERVRLHAALEQAAEDFRQGRSRPAKELIVEVRAKHPKASPSTAEE